MLAPSLLKHLLHPYLWSERNWRWYMRSMKCFALGGWLLLWILVTALCSCSIFDVVEGPALKAALQNRWTRLQDRLNYAIEAEQDRGNYRRACELVNEFKAEALKICRVAHDRGLRSTCEEDSKDFLPYKCELIEDAQPFSLPTSPLP